jgi:hypothetical protein
LAVIEKALELSLINGRSKNGADLFVYEEEVRINLRLDSLAGVSTGNRDD